MFEGFKKSNTGHLIIILKAAKGWRLVAYVYNPCYSGGRDQEDHS
jgi:hypothetical protein